ncbi:hypothetical protein [Pseudomonas sp. UMAB-40]|uniref:hypothetical protein n=1 Tax=Pseudomonas sp. UMAB-40 TaxID=1365407 RepID=UPI001C59AD30|nr:hypothetical protein [Pseudomonas sp. UMAB-40]
MRRAPNISPTPLFIDELPHLLARRFCTSAIDHLFIDGTSYEGLIWKLRFSENSAVPNKVIDFRVLIYNGSLLTSDENIDLLQIFKGLIACQLLPRFNGGQPLVGATLYYKVLRTLSFIDWLLINGLNFEIATSHFALISKRHIQKFLAAVSTMKIWDGAYEYTGKLKEWLLLNVSCLSDVDYANVLSAQPLLGTLIPEEDWALGLKKEELLRARAWLYSAGYYKRKEGRLFFHASSFISKTYAGTLHGHSISPFVIPELVLEDSYSRECLGVSVRRSFEEGFSRVAESKYSDVISMIGVINAEICDSGMSLDVALSKIPDIEFLDFTEKSRDGRYRSVPAPVLLGTLRKAIEFYLKSSNEIFTAIRSCASNAPKQFDRVIMDNRVSLHTFAKSLRLSGWTQKNTLGLPFDYNQFRESPCLCELYNVLVGVSSYVVGMIMARRQGELISLRDDNCLEPNINPYLPSSVGTHYYMVFDLMKSGAGDKRERVRRAIPLIVAKILWDHKEFKRSLKDAKLLRIETDRQLFQVANAFSVSFTALSSTRHNESLDQMHDFLEVDTVTDECGIQRRYYIRQHQLRRFWAQVFFWINGRDGLDTLSMFLGHTDPEMLYRYILEEIPGSMLLDAKHERVMDAIREDDRSVRGLDQLLSILHEKFETMHLHFKTVSDIERDIGYSVNHGLVNTVPTFEDFCSSAKASNIIGNLLAAKTVDIYPEFISFDAGDGMARTRVELCLRVNK